MNTMITFTEEQKNFMMNYSPENQHFTSCSEVAKIIDVFALHNADYNEIRNIRNGVVKFYYDICKAEIIYDDNGEYVTHTDNYWKYNTAMMSITAAIDHHNYNYI